MLVRCVYLIFFQYVVFSCQVRKVRILRKISIYMLRCLWVCWVGLDIYVIQVIRLVIVVLQLGDESVFGVICWKLMSMWVFLFVFLFVLFLNLVMCCFCSCYNIWGMLMFLNIVLFQLVGCVLLWQKFCRYVYSQLWLCVCFLIDRLGGVVLSQFFVLLGCIVMDIVFLILLVVNRRFVLIFFWDMFRFVRWLQCIRFVLWQFR